MEVENHLWKTCIIICDLTCSRPAAPPEWPLLREDREEIEHDLGIKKKTRRRKLKKINE